MYCPEADRGGGEGAGAQAEVDDGVLPAPDADHLDGLRLPRSTTRRLRGDEVRRRMDVHGEEGGGGSGSRPRTEAAMDAATRMRGWRWDSKAAHWNGPASGVLPLRRVSR